MRRIVLLLSLLLLADGLHGQIPEGMEGSAFRPHPEAERAISQLYSPFCPGFMLEVCTAQASIALRDSIQYLAYQGMNSDQLVAWMLSNHGEQYRAVPLRSGSGLWAWLLPPLALGAGVFVVVLALQRLVRGRREDEATESAEPALAGRAVSGEDEERLRNAIREIELSEDPSF